MVYEREGAALDQRYQVNSRAKIVLSKIPLCQGQRVQDTCQPMSSCTEYSP